MDINACMEKIDRHLANQYVQPLIVDVQTRTDLSALVTHYNVSGNVFAAASQYCKADEYPQLEELLDSLSSQNQRIFVTGLSAFLKLQGEQVVRDTLYEILGMAVAGHVVVITYQCGRYLNSLDPRLKQRIAIVDGKADEVPSLVFLAQDLALSRHGTQLSGVDRIGAAVEDLAVSTLYVKTKKRKSDYPNSLLVIDEIHSAYDILAQRDRATADLREDYGTREQWNDVLQQFGDRRTWADLIDAVFGNHGALDIAFHSFKTFDRDKRWLYFIALKLFGAKNSWCLHEAVQQAASVKDFVKQAYRSLLDVPKERADFKRCYLSRKNVVTCLGNLADEVIDYCRIVQVKGKEAIYYLTDNTQKEKELIFQLLDRYAEAYTKEEVCAALKLVYPALYQYLSAYRFKNELLDTYFQHYKYQKVINRVWPVFEEIVKEQARKREYNLILEPRVSKIEAIDRTGAQLYFVDAMGVEYLGYIMSVCRVLRLMAKVTVCRCELPSITSKNKEFLAWFENGPFPIVSIKDLDDIKHHGKDNVDYQQTKLPIHLMRELEIIEELLKKIKERLADGTIERAVLIADHGASRLAVIHETECVWAMASKGEHSGRCCLKTEVDAQPEYAADAGEFWALANYDRFKGGRKANVEVHGGAALEEVTVPVIELTCLPQAVELHLLPLDAACRFLEGVPEITVSYRKKAAIKIFATAKLQNVSIEIAGKCNDAVFAGDGFYTVEMPDIKRAGIYSVDVYTCENRIAEGLSLKVTKEGASERSLL